MFFLTRSDLDDVQRRVPHLTEHWVEVLVTERDAMK